MPAKKRVDNSNSPAGKKPAATRAAAAAPPPPSGGGSIPVSNLLVLSPSRIAAVGLVGLVAAAAASQFFAVIDGWDPEFYCPRSFDEADAIARTHFGNGTRIPADSPAYAADPAFRAAAATLAELDLKASDAGGLRGGDGEDARRLYALPMVHYLHSGLHRGFDYMNCVLTQFFRDAMTGAGAGELGVVFGLHTICLFVAFLLLAGFERTRLTTRFPANSFALVGVLAQFIGAGVAVPALWLLPWLVNYPARTTAPGAARPSHLGSDAQLHLVGVGMLWFGALGVAMTQPTLLNYAFVPFQYLPGLLPLFFAASRWLRRPRPAHHRSLSSAVATGWYKFAQSGLALPDLFAVALLVKTVVEAGAATDSGPSLAPLWDFATTPLSLRPQSALPAYFLLVDTAALTACAAVWVWAELGWFELAKFAAFAVVVGPGAALMGAAAAREKLVEEVMRKEFPDVPVAPPRVPRGAAVEQEKQQEKQQQGEETKPVEGASEEAKKSK